MLLRLGSTMARSHYIIRTRTIWKRSLFVCSISPWGPTRLDFGYLVVKRYLRQACLNYLKKGEYPVDIVQKRVIAPTGLFPIVGARSNAKAQLNEFCIVTLTGNQQAVGTPPVPWTEVQYTDPNNGTPVTGWVYDGYLEGYPNAGNVVPIESSV